MSPFFTAIAFGVGLTTRGDESNQVNTLSRDRAERLLLDAVRETPDPNSHHALGLLYLTRKEFAKAIEQFAEALKADPMNAQIYADLGPARLEEAKAKRVATEPGKSLEKFAQSIEDLSKALELNGGLLSARFNLALCYEEMGLSHKAIEEWRSYLKLDASSPWAAEGRRRLEKLEKNRESSLRKREAFFDQFLSAFHERNDEAAWELIVGSYTSAGSVIANRLLDSFVADQIGTADKYLEALSYLGNLELQRTGDRFYSDLARFYESQPSSGRVRLGKLRQLVNDAYERFTKSRFSEAIAIYTKANHGFEALTGFEESLFIQYRVAHCYLLELNAQKSQEILERLSTSCKKRGYQWLLGQALLCLASNSFNLSEYSKAVTYNSRSLELFEATGHTDGISTT